MFYEEAIGGELSLPCFFFFRAIEFMAMSEKSGMIIVKQLEKLTDRNIGKYDRTDYM